MLLLGPLRVHDLEVVHRLRIPSCYSNSDRAAARRGYRGLCPERSRGARLAPSGGNDPPREGTVESPGGSPSRSHQPWCYHCRPPERRPWGSACGPLPHRRFRRRYRGGRPRRASRRRPCRSPSECQAAPLHGWRAGAAHGEGRASGGGGTGEGGSAVPAPSRYSCTLR